MSYSFLATTCCFLTVSALGFFLFGASSDAVWCYVVGSICLLPLVGTMIYAWCIYPCKEQHECCYAREGCREYCCGPQQEPKPKPMPKPSAPPAAEQEQLPSAPPAIHLFELVIEE